MKRRDVLKYAAWATGTAISSPLMHSILSGAAGNFKNTGSSYVPKFFSEEQFKLLTALADTILPKTDSPSASEVGVPNKIDGIVSAVYPKNAQAGYLDRFKTLAKYLDGSAGNLTFAGLDGDSKLEVLRKLESAGNNATRWTYLEVKQQVISYYLTSEEIGENYLNYLPVPGYYDPCVTVESVGGKAWSL